MSLRHWCVFIKERSNEVRVDSHEKQSDENHKQPEIDVEVISAPVDNLDDASQDGRLDQLTNHKLLDLILDVETWSLLVEPVLLLEHKLLVDTEGEPCDGAEDAQVQGEQD